MLYPSYLTVAVAAVLSLQHVAATPLEVKMGDGNGANKQTITDTMPLVNQKIKNMKAVIYRPDAQTHPAVVKAFGANAKWQKSERTLTPSIHAEPGVTQGATNMGNKHVVFGSTFYSSDANTRAGTIIHEASHAKAGTVDHFKTDGTPGTRNDPGVHVGYKDSHMSELNAKHSDQMHHNADAYRVFGDKCPNVRRSLYRRAMEESHPVIRSELLRRAAHACAWKPKGEAATPVAKHADADHKSSTSAKHLEKGSAHAKSAVVAKKVHKVSSKKSPLSGGAKRLSKVNAAKKAAAGGKAAHAGVHAASKKAAKVAGGKVAHAGSHAGSKKVGKVAHAGSRAVPKKRVGGKVTHVGSHSPSKKAVRKTTNTGAYRSVSKEVAGKTMHGAGAHAASKKSVGKVSHSAHASSKRVQTKTSRPVHRQAAAAKAIQKAKPVQHQPARKSVQKAKAVQHQPARKSAQKAKPAQHKPPPRLVQKAKPVQHKPASKPIQKAKPIEHKPAPKVGGKKH